MSKKVDAQILRNLVASGGRAVYTHYETLSRVAAQLEADAKQDEKYEALQAIGKSAFDGIAEMVAALECDYDRLGCLKSTFEAEGLINAEARLELHDLQVEAGDCTNRDDAEQRIHEHPLSLQVRGDWHAQGEEDNTPTEFEILLGTGGPATRIIGELSDGQPTRARLQAQDWGTAWTDYRGGDSETLLTYCRCFCFGEG